MKHRAQNPVASQPAAPAKRRGTVTLLVLLLVATVAALVTQGQLGAYIRRRAAGHHAAETRLRRLAFEGVRGAARQLAAATEGDATNLLRSGFAQLEWSPAPGTTVTVTLEDLERKLDLNNLYIEGEPAEAEGGGRTVADILGEAFRFSGEAAPGERLAALRDWMDPDQDGFHEAPWPDTDARPPNYWLDAPAELDFVPGFAPAWLTPRPEMPEAPPLFATPPAELFTIIPGPRREPWRVNVNSASRPVLLAVLGLEHQPWVEALLIERQARPLDDLEPLQAGADQALQARLARYLAVRSRHFAVRARAREAERTREAWALLRREAEGQVSWLRCVWHP
ncbi:MAG: general secretion pathway protein GspK [Candidatus Marinimicrobia bacterium]|nr:general secretion pathway protein GspK [Candidatus Neomarinimicrobiota bacterium]